ncbi:EAL domain-containing protein [Shewanella cyperi]|uniref:EAL domain-containing protein n=1 Tax=Shewanella cyperi TaxID=2814292 RepID=UPI001A9470EC|nr:EAL domain-containing protein [Shewanella cyperi]QSX42346.1 EAL domain-containing protein [Shewanella cyperi]
MKTRLLMGCEYQALVDTISGDTLGYEALARFQTLEGQAVAPNSLFERLHHNPAQLARVELAAKACQLRHAPHADKLFLNIDPHSLQGLDDDWFEALAQRGNITIELIENTCINDAVIATELAHRLQHHGIRVALDDAGAPHALLSLPLLAQVDCIKFDRHWLDLLQDDCQRTLLEHLLGFARETGKNTVLEGIETQEQLTLARRLGLDMVQGFLFRERFIRQIPDTPLELNFQAQPD